MKLSFSSLVNAGTGCPTFMASMRLTSASMASRLLNNFCAAGKLSTHMLTRYSLSMNSVNSFVSLPVNNLRHKIWHPGECSCMCNWYPVDSIRSPAKTSPKFSATFSTSKGSPSALVKPLSPGVQNGAYSNGIEGVVRTTKGAGAEKPLVDAMFCVARNKVLASIEDEMVPNGLVMDPGPVEYPSVMGYEPY